MTLNTLGFRTRKEKLLEQQTDSFWGPNSSLLGCLLEKTPMNSSIDDTMFKPLLDLLYYCSPPGRIKRSHYTHGALIALVPEELP